MSSDHNGDDWDKHWAAMHTTAGQNPAQDYRRRLLVAELHRYFSGSSNTIRLLDIGCGTGDFALEFQQAFPDAAYLGVDVSQVGTEICRSKVPGARFETVDLTQALPVAASDQAWANAVVCSEVLEHVDEPEKILRNVRPWLAPGALILITVPGGPMSAFDMHIGHRRHFSNSQLKSLLRSAGYRVQAVYGAGFPFFNLYRMVVIARGRKLVADASKPEGPMSPVARLVMGLFGFLFHFNRNHSRLGWQRLAVAFATDRAEISPLISSSGGNNSK